LEEAIEVAVVEGLVGHWRSCYNCKASLFCNTCLTGPTALATTFPCMHSPKMHVHITCRLPTTDKWLLGTKATKDAIVEKS
jgi:hypothetical protein